MPMMIFGLNEKDSIVNTVNGVTQGTLVTACQIRHKDCLFNILDQPRLPRLNHQSTRLRYRNICNSLQVGRLSVVIYAYFVQGLTPNNDGKAIRLTFPELTEERRKELVKDVKKKAENADRPNDPSLSPNFITKLS